MLVTLDGRGEEAERHTGEREGGEIVCARVRVLGWGGGGGRGHTLERERARMKKGEKKKRERCVACVFGTSTKNRCNAQENLGGGCGCRILGGYR